ncbi:MAG TPA: ankyrin repeat domain-containing protein, partial [Vicinamibacteria bacterium]
MFDGQPKVHDGEHCVVAMTAADVLCRYQEELLPEFASMNLVDVNQVGNFGNTPLTVAAVRGLMDELVALLDAGAALDFAGEHGYTALHHAAAQGHA